MEWRTRFNTKATAFFKEEEIMIHKKAIILSLAAFILKFQIKKPLNH